jgi:NADH-quinone oxidoreductase subunit J
MSIAFFILCAIVVMACGVVIFSKKLVYAAYALIITMLSVAGIFLLNNAEFVAVVQIMVYIGGVITLLLFTLLIHNQRLSIANTIAPTWLLSTIFCVAVGVFIYYFPPNFGTTSSAVAAHSLLEIGKLFLTTYALPFEIIGVLLTVLLCAIAYLFKKTT